MKEEGQIPNHVLYEGQKKQEEGKRLEDLFFLSMIISTCNVRVFNDRLQHGVASHVKKCKIDIICLEETKVKQHKKPSLKQK